MNIMAKVFIILFCALSHHSFARAAGNESSVFENICSYFPSSLQTISAKGVVEFNGNGVLFYLENRDTLNFKSVKVRNKEDKNNNGCIYDGTNKEVCVTSNTIQHDNFPPILPNFVSGSANKECASDNKNCEIIPGAYKAITLNNNSTLTFSPGEYWISSLLLNNGASIETKGQVVIHYKTLHVAGNAVNMNANESDNYEDLVLIGHYEHGVPPLFLRGESLQMKALWYHDDASGIVITNNSFDFEGSITAVHIKSSTRNHIINAKPPSQCGEPDGLYGLKITPPIDSALVCGSDFPTFTINTTKDGVPSAQGVTVNLYLKSPGDSNYLQAKVVDNIGMVVGKGFRTNSLGQLKLAIHPGDVNQTVVNQKYIIEVRLNADRRVEESRNFQFYPFEFTIDDVTAIAGNPINVVATAYACAADNKPVIATTYSGTPTVTYELVTPSATIGGIKGNLVYGPNFERGQAKDELTIDEVGLFNITLEDPNFDCEGLNHCPGVGRLKGSFELKARPWTFALCRSDMSPLPSGDISNPSSAGFAAAGERFSINALPIRWRSGGSTSGSIATKDAYCNSSLITQNFSKGKAGNIQIELDHSLNLPHGGEVGVLNGTKVKDYTLATDGYYSFSDLNWNEVGQIKLNVASDNYLGVSIQSGEKDLGRFYPKYFQVYDLSDTKWHYALGQSFNYMNQPFTGVDFQVEALSMARLPTLNYSSFVPDLQAKFMLSEPFGRFSSPPIKASSWNRSTRSIGEYNGVSTGKCDNISTSFCWSKREPRQGYEDGPFNLNGSATDDDTTTPTSIAITNGGSVDPVEIKQEEGVLTAQPDIRFGRVALNSAGGVASHEGVTIPLRIEYWNGRRFVVNTDDNQADVKGKNIVSKNLIVWTDDNDLNKNTEVNLSLGGVVNEGASYSILAKQAHLVRQQTQVWLELDDTANQLPWFQYHWDDSISDESNPSTVATFGIYRGHDKIIFRGEPGLTGL